MIVLPGDNHQNSEADGWPGEHGRQRCLAWEMEAEAHCTFPSGDKPYSLFFIPLLMTAGVVTVQMNQK